MSINFAQTYAILVKNKLLTIQLAKLNEELETIKANNIIKNIEIDTAISGVFTKVMEYIKFDEEVTNFLAHGKWLSFDEFIKSNEADEMYSRYESFIASVVESVNTAFRLSSLMLE